MSRDHQHFGGLDLVKTRERADGFAAQVHISERLAEQELAVARELGLPRSFRSERPARGGEAVEDHEAGIVARPGILTAGIAQAHDEPQRGAGRGESPPALRSGSERRGLLGLLLLGLLLLDDFRLAAAASATPAGAASTTTVGGGDADDREVAIGRGR